MKEITKKKKAKARLLEWAIAVKERDNYTCQICGGTEYLNSHHVVDKKFKEFKWDVKNGITLCAGCHKFKFLSAHLNPLWFVLWFAKKNPERYMFLQEKVKVKIKADKRKEIK